MKQEECLEGFCFNVNNLFEDGLYGKIVKVLVWLNFRKKYLKLIWDFNRGNVQNLEQIGGE